MPKLTKRFVEATEIGATRYDIFDSQIPGFGIRIAPSGTRTYVLMYRSGGRRWRVSLGRHGIVTPEQARDAAIDILARVKRGENPAASRQGGGQITTVADLAERFETEHIAVRIKPRTAKEYRRNLKLFILPALGRFKVTEVTRADVARFHHEFRDTPYQSNRNLEIVSKMFNLAEMWGLRPDGSNPCRHVKKYKEEKRERYLSADELARLGEVLRQCEQDGIESASTINLIRLLMLTGCRLSEIQTLKWEYVDFENRALHLPDSKTGVKTVHLGPPALKVLIEIESIEGNPWVITGKLENTHLQEPQRPWRRIRKRAGLDDVRIHDLRHTFASVAVSGGQGLPMIGQMLGHTQVQTTARYAHLATEPVKRATDDVSTTIGAAMGGEVAP